MPDVGFNWIKTVGSGTTLLAETSAYVGFLEALAVRWAAGDMSRLQPTMAAPCWYALALLANMMRKKAGQEEMKLLGRSGTGRPLSAADAAFRPPPSARPVPQGIPRTPMVQQARSFPIRRA
jgi:hypothetical protein